jgi:hypothetical protein
MGLDTLWTHGTMWFKAPHATAGWKCVIMVSWGMTTIMSPYDGQQQGNNQLTVGDLWLWLEDLLEVANSLLASSLKAAKEESVYRVRTMFEHQWKAPVRMSEHCQGWKHTSGDVLSRRAHPKTCAQCQKVWVIAADATLRREQQDDDGPILWEMQCAEHPEWKEMADHSPTYKSYWAQWNSLVVRDGVLECQWEAASRLYKTDQIALCL